MKAERTYLVEYRRGGRGHRNDALKTLKIQARNGRNATAAAKAHPKLQGMKIVSICVDPKFWVQLGKQKEKEAKLKKRKAKKVPKAPAKAAAPKGKQKTAKT